MRIDKAEKYFKLAKYFAELFSKDPSTKVGCIILAPESLQILSMGYNGMPRGVDETIKERWERPQKLMWCEHAERNAIANASRHGTPLENGIAIITMFPCADCARLLIQSGIKTIVSKEPNLVDSKWSVSFTFSLQMFKEADIKLIYVNDT